MSGMSNGDPAHTIGVELFRESERHPGMFESFARGAFDTDEVTFSEADAVETLGLFVASLHAKGELIVPLAEVVAQARFPGAGQIAVTGLGKQVSEDA